jgi:hypothetical protein
MTGQVEGEGLVDGPLAKRKWSGHKGRPCIH